MSSMFVFSVLDQRRCSQMVAVIGGYWMATSLVALIHPALSIAVILPPLTTLSIFLSPLFRFYTDVDCEQFRIYPVTIIPSSRFSTMSGLTRYERAGQPVVRNLMPSTGLTSILGSDALLRCVFLFAIALATLQLPLVRLISERVRLWVSLPQLRLTSHTNRRRNPRCSMLENSIHIANEIG